MTPGTALFVLTIALGCVVSPWFFVLAAVPIIAGLREL